MTTVRAEQRLEVRKGKEIESVMEFMQSCNLCLRGRRGQEILDGCLHW